MRIQIAGGVNGQGLTHLALINAVMHVITADAALVRGASPLAVPSATA
jgi:hypothetical protein